MFNYFIYLDDKPDGLSHRQNLKPESHDSGFFIFNFIHHPISKKNHLLRS